MARLVATALAALLLTGCSEGSSSPSADPSGPSTLPFACPDPSTTVHPTPGDRLPAGVRAARICSTAEPVAWLAPPEPLTEGVAALVAVVNRQGAAPHSGSCNLDAGPAYSIVLDYADGARIITGDTAGCRNVRVGSVDRVGGRTVWHTYLRLLARQRAHIRPGPVPVSRRPTCVTTDHRLPSTPLWDVRVLRRARLCVLATKGPGVAMSRREVRVLRRDVMTAAGRSQWQPMHPRGCGPDVRLGYDVVAVDAWGDVVDIRGYCDVYLAIAAGASRPAYVRELPSTRRMFARLAARA